MQVNEKANVAVSGTVAITTLIHVIVQVLVIGKFCVRLVLGGYSDWHGNGLQDHMDCFSSAETYYNHNQQPTEGRGSYT